MAPEQDANPCGGPTGFITIMVALFVMLIMFDPSLGKAVVHGMDYLMGPIKFGGQFPVWTIFFSGFILVIITTVIRHKFTDWYETAKTQKISTAFNKELREATFSGNTIKSKQLQQMQPQIMKMTNKMMFTNMKTMIFTMFIAILIWRWLYSYLGDLTITTISLPWNSHWSINNTINVCPIPLPYWILIYFVISVPIGQVLVSLLKVIEFSKESRQAEAAYEDSVRKRLSSIEETVNDSKRRGLMTSQVEAVLAKAESAMDDREFSIAEKHLDDAEMQIEQASANRKRTEESIATVRTMLESSAARGINVTAIEQTINNAEAALARNDFTRAIYFSKQAQQKLRSERERHEEAEMALGEVKEIMSEVPESVRKLMEDRMSEVESAMGDRSYTTVLDSVKKFKGEAESTQKLYESAKDELERAKKLKDTLVKASMDISEHEDKLRNAEDKYNLADYSGAFDYAKDVADEMEKLKKLYEDASETVSFAKLVVANAREFGADVIKAESLIIEAENALEANDYGEALSKATSAKNLAEESKRLIQRDQKRGRGR